MPWSIGGGLLTNRKSWFEEMGYATTSSRRPGTSAATPARSSRPRAAPIGQSLGHTFGDPVVFWYPFLWSWGGKEVEADGKTVALNSKETVESVKFAVALLEGRL